MAEQRRLLISPERLTTASNSIALNPGELHYLQRVLRLKPGGGFTICDGCGGTYLASLGNPGSANLLEKLPAIQAATPKINLLFGLFRRDLDLMLRMATELGVDQLQPLQAEYSLLEPGEQRIDRWKTILKEATEQSERCWLPLLEQPKLAVDGLASPAAAGVCRWIGVTREAGVCSLQEELQSHAAVAAQQWQLACGPEGGWSPAELQIAVTAGWKAITLSSTVLRCSTAAICALALMQHQRLQLNGYKSTANLPGHRFEIS